MSSNDPELKSRLLFLIYKTLILDYGASALRNTFEKEKLIINEQVIPPKELYTLLYNDKIPSVPLEYALRVFQNVESFLLKENLSLSNFMQQLIHKRTNIFMVSSGQAVMQACEPHFGELFACEDPHEYVLNRVDIIHKLRIPQSRIKKICTSVENAEVITLMEVNYCLKEYHRYAHNLDLWKASFLKEAPLCIGATPFNAVYTIADCRRVHHIFPDSTQTDQKVLLKGEEIGVVRRYRDFLEDLNVDISKCHGDPQVIGVVATVDIYRENDTIPRLRKGCFYGASSNILRVSYTPVEFDSSRALEKLVKDIIPVPENREPLFAQRHNELLATFEENITVTFHRAQKRVYINDTLFARGFPAFLFYFLSSRIKDGRTEPFKYQEIIEDPHFSGILDPLTPNLNVRISRLKEKLKKEFPLWEIKSSGKGEFHFLSHVDYSVSEPV